MRLSIICIISFFVSLTAGMDSYVFSTTNTNSPDDGFFYEQLTLDMPENAVAQFCHAYTQGDFVTVFFILSKNTQNKVIRAINKLQLDRIIDDEAELNGFSLFPRDSEHGNAIMFLFARIMRSAQEQRNLLLNFTGLEQIVKVRYMVDSGSGEECEVLTELEGLDETVSFFLVKSPNGRWRVSRILFCLEEEEYRSWP